MSIIRLIGAVLLILTSSLYGWLQAKELMERRFELNYLSQLIAAFKSEVSFQRSSLGEIFLKISEKSRLPYQNIFHGIYQGMERGRKSFEYMWQEALERMEAETCLKKEDIQYMMELTNLAKAVDCRYREEIFEQVSGEMEEQKKHLESEYRQKGRVYCCMGITIGILGVIILI
ncbi:MAG: stage III sporulation protein AB [Lachnospiraceae bacterium]|nr:stage III sporulation protein AB [Lachnospiraceae bacterium]MDE6744765.1 stage III sporulation protein AB [Lachnospiraceae bacterium]